jgi:hypothetical protein
VSGNDPVEKAQRAAMKKAHKPVLRAAVIYNNCGHKSMPILSDNVGAIIPTLET